MSDNPVGRPGDLLSVLSVRTVGILLCHAADKGQLNAWRKGSHDNGLRVLAWAVRNIRDPDGCATPKSDTRRLIEKMLEPLCLRS